MTVNAETIVGSLECPVRRIMKSFKGSGSFHLFTEKLQEFSDELGIPQDVLNNVQQKILLFDGYEIYGGVRDLISHWVGTNGSQAELGVLMTALDNISLTMLRECLLETNCDIPKITPQPVPQNLENIKFKVLPPVKNFCGRDEELRKLHGIISVSNSKYLKPKFACISGLGGMGKTQLARKYIQQYGSEFQGNCVWLNAFSKNSLLASFKELSANLQIPLTKNAKIQQVAQDCYDFFKGCKSLFVFDDVDESTWLKDFFPAPGELQNITIILTSRVQTWYREVQVLSLKELTPDDASTVIKKGFEGIEGQDLKFSSEDLLSLAKRLQFFPLALQQAIAYITNENDTDNYSIVNYLVDFEVKQRKLLSANIGELMNYAYPDDEYAKVTFTTWQLTIDKIKNKPEVGPIAEWILNITAYLDHSRIDRNIFCQPESNADIHEVQFDYDLKLNETVHNLNDFHLNSQNLSINPEKVKQAVRLLVNFSMVNGSSGEEKQTVLNVHRLVQEVTRINLKEKGEDAEILEDVIKMLNGKDNFPKENINHALITWKHAIKHFSLFKANLHQISSIAIKLEEIGRIQETLSFLGDIIKSVEKQFHKNHKEYFQLGCIHLSILAGTERIEDAFERAKFYYSEALSIFKEEDPRLLSVKGYLAVAFQRTGQPSESSNYFLSIHKATVKTYGKSHIESLNAQQNYLILLTDLGKFEVAIDAYSKLIKEYENRSTEHAVYRANISLGHVHYRKMDYHQALHIWEDVYPMITQVWEEDVILFAKFCCNYVKLLVKLDRCNDAFNIIEVNQIKIKELGEFHCEWIKFLQVRGTVCRIMGDFDLAVEVHEKAYQSFVKLYEEKHLDTQMAKREWAQDLLAKGDNAESAKLLGEVMNMLKELASPGSKQEIEFTNILLAQAENKT